MDSVCGRKQAGKVEGNSCLSADAAGVSQMSGVKLQDSIKSHHGECKTETNRILREITLFVITVFETPHHP